MSLRRLLGNPSVRRYLLGQVASTTGDTSIWLAAAIWVKSLTHSSSEAGLTAFIFALPALGAPILGWVTDRFERRKVLLLINVITACVVLGLLGVQGRSTFWIVWLVMFVYGVSNTLLTTTQSAFLVELVDADLLSYANSVLRTAREALRLIAPVVGAGLFVLVGGHVIAIIDALTFLVSFVCIASIDRSLLKPVNRTARGWSWIDLSDGLRHLLEDSDLRRLSLATASVMAVAGFTETVSFVLVAHRLHQPPSFVGVLVGLMGLGAVAGGLLAPMLIQRMKDVAATGLGMLLIGVGGALWVAPFAASTFAGAVAMGVGLPITLVGAYTAVQVRTDPGVLGRVMGGFELLVGVPQLFSIGLGAALVVALPVLVPLVLLSAVCLLAGSRLLLRKPVPVPAGSRTEGA